MTVDGMKAVSNIIFFKIKNTSRENKNFRLCKTLLINFFYFRSLH